MSDHARQKDLETVLSVPSSLSAPPPHGEEPKDLATLIQEWRDDDRQGYDEAIDLLCVAHYTLLAQAAEIKKLRTLHGPAGGAPTDALGEQSDESTGPSEAARRVLGRMGDPDACDVARAYLTQAAKIETLKQELAKLIEQGFPKLNEAKAQVTQLTTALQSLQRDVAELCHLVQPGDSITHLTDADYRQGLQEQCVIRIDEAEAEVSQLTTALQAAQDELVKSCTEIERLKARVESEQYHKWVHDGTTAQAIQRADKADAALLASQQAQATLQKENMGLRRDIVDLEATEERYEALQAQIRTLPRVTLSCCEMVNWSDVAALVAPPAETPK